MGITFRRPTTDCNITQYNKHSGQGLVEFALVIPLFLLLVIGIIELGHLLAVVISTYTSSQEAIRYGTAVGPNDMGVPHYVDCSGIQATAMRLGAIGGVDAHDVQIRYDHGPGDSRDWYALPSCPLSDFEIESIQLGDRMVVRATGNYKPFFLNFAEFPITSEAARTIIKDVDIEGTSAPSPTPKNSRTPTTTATSTATSTPTETPTPTLTFTATETPIYTYTPSQTATETPVPTQTSIPSITPTFTVAPTLAPNCQNYVAYTPQFSSSKEVVYPLWNLGPSSLHIVSVSMVWSQNTTLTEMNLVNGFLKTYLASWQGPANNRAVWYLEKEIILEPSQRIDLRAKFQSTIKSPPSISVYLENGCVIRYPNWYW